MTIDDALVARVIAAVLEADNDTDYWGRQAP